MRAAASVDEPEGGALSEAPVSMGGSPAVGNRRPLRSADTGDAHVQPQQQSG